MTGNSQDSSTSPPHGRRIRRPLLALAGAAVTAALLVGCGGADTEEPDEGVSTDRAEESTPTDDSTETSAPEEPAESDAPSDADDSDGSESADDSDGDGDAGGENLFEGTWGFGHDTKTLDAEELADLLEEEAESRGPEEMSLDVECDDGVDTGAADDTADCVAYADEGVEHLWRVTVGPADAGLVLEVENVS